MEYDKVETNIVLSNLLGSRSFELKWKVVEERGRVRVGLFG